MIPKKTHWSYMLNIGSTKKRDINKSVLVNHGR